MAIGVLDQIIKDIKSDVFFKDYKYKRALFDFFLMRDDSFLSIVIGHKRDWLNDAIVIKPVCGKQFFILTKWFEKFSVLSLQDQRTNDNVSFYGNTLGLNGEISFKYDLSDYNEKIIALIKLIKEMLIRVDNDYATLEDFYNRDVLPKLDGVQKFGTWGSDWMFHYLALGYLIDPNRYPELKSKLLQIMELQYRRHDPHMSIYYDRLDEIISYMENNVKL